jgi:hypothetical protein
MEPNFSPPRLAIFAACLAIFWWMGGFSIEIDPDGIRDPGKVERAWRYCVMLFVAGAACVSLVDHHFGTIERSSLRIVYIIIGVLLMVGSSLWLQGLKRQAGPGEKPAMERR